MTAHQGDWNNWYFFYPSCVVRQTPNAAVNSLAKSNQISMGFRKKSFRYAHNLPVHLQANCIWNGFCILQEGIMTGHIGLTVANFGAKKENFGIIVERNIRFLLRDL